MIIKRFIYFGTFILDRNSFSRRRWQGLRCTTHTTEIKFWSQYYPAGLTWIWIKSGCCIWDWDTGHKFWGIFSWCTKVVRLFLHALFFLWNFAWKIFSSKFSLQLKFGKSPNGQNSLLFLKKVHFVFISKAKRCPYCEEITPVVEECENNHPDILFQRVILDQAKLKVYILK